MRLSMMKQTKLAKAIAYAVAGVALTAGSASTASATVTTMYNLSTNFGEDNSANVVDPTASGIWPLSGGTDGWVNGANSPSTGTGTNSNGAKWAGTTGAYDTPFGYTGAHLNWGFAISGGNGGSGEISTYDAFNKYGTYADIDTAKGAWSDAGEPASQGWRHDLDTGLFKSDTTGVVTLNASGIMQAGTNFGFTIFKGMDTVTSYSHHGGWNPLNNVPGLTPFSLPWGDIPVPGKLAVSDIVAYSVGGTTPSNLNTISFNAVAGQVYSIFLGGYRNGLWMDTNDGYKLSVTQSAVPVPGAVWLFGSALVGLVGAQRRKKQAA
jgi:hypothetical protein